MSPPAEPSSSLLDGLRAVYAPVVAMRQALDEGKPKVDERTWTVFWRVVVDGQDVARVAEEMGMTAGAVRVAKCRVLQRLRDEME